MRTVAIPQFMEEFGDLLSVRAEVTEFERSLIEGVYEQIYLVREQKHQWTRRVRAAFHFLDQGHLNSPKSVAEHFLNSANQLALLLNTAHASKLELRNAKMNEEGNVRDTLAYYKQLVEGPFRVLLAPVAFGFARKMKLTDRDFVPQRDGKASLNALRKIERYLVYPQNQLSIGYNSHVRNAYAHEKYRALDGGKVELWDEEPSTRRAWGPETWTLEQLEDLVQQLELTIRGLTMALAIYSANTRAFIGERRITPTIPLPPVIFRDLKASLEHFARKYGFDLRQTTKDGKTLRLIVRTELRGIDQESEIYVGGNKWSRRFKQPIKYIEVPVVAQALELIRQCEPVLDEYDEVALAVLNPDDETVGEFAIRKDQLSRLIGPDAPPLQEARKLAHKDTVGDTSMHVRLEGQAYEG
jgi:hypothetical protein